MIALLVLGSLVIFILIVFLAYKYIMKVSSLMIDGKEEVKEMIVNTGRSPLSWAKKITGERRPWKKKWIKWRCIRKIKRLIRYYTFTTLVADENERQYIIKALRNTKKSWAQSRLEDILLP
jgi:hypothetical protein